MKLSARNQLTGKIINIEDGAVNAKITLELKGGDKITSIITMEAVKDLGLEIGKEAIAIVKASSVMMATE